MGPFLKRPGIFSSHVCIQYFSGQVREKPTTVLKRTPLN